MESEMQINIIQTNIKNDLLAVAGMNQYALIIKLATLLYDTQVKILVYNFNNSMITKEDGEKFENSNKCRF